MNNLIEKYANACGRLIGATTFTVEKLSEKNRTDFDLDYLKEMLAKELKFIDEILKSDERLEEKAKIEEGCLTQDLRAYHESKMRE